jgi:hypothetical protein
VLDEFIARAGLELAARIAAKSLAAISFRFVAIGANRAPRR